MQNNILLQKKRINTVQPRPQTPPADIDDLIFDKDKIFIPSER